MHSNILLVLMIKITICSAWLIHRKTTSAVEDFKVKDAVIIACGEDKCQKVKEFNIAGNNTYSCHDVYIGINVEIGDSGTKIPSFVYLTQNDGVTAITQKNDPMNCPRIKM